jgi:hypothetical protein
VSGRNHYPQPTNHHPLIKKEKNMNRISAFAAAIAISAWTTAMLANSPLTATSKDVTNTEATFAADGAFRDGLYLGKLSAERGQPLRPQIGRWSTRQDRSMFTAGYHRGYREFVASARVNAERPVE